MHQRDLPQRWQSKLDDYLAKNSSGNFPSDLAAANFDGHVQLKFADGSSGVFHNCFWLSDASSNEMLLVTQRCLHHIFPLKGTELVRLSDEEVYGSNRQRLREYDQSDATETLKLFLNTIREINSADYDPQQVAAWASDSIDAKDWNDQFTGRFAYVVVLDGDIIGFADMTNAGYLDRLYVSAKHQRQGVGTMLLEKLKSDASESKLTELYTDSSITAMPFFGASGFLNVRKQTVQCRGVDFTNYRMVLAMRSQRNEEGQSPGAVVQPMTSAGR